MIVKEEFDLTDYNSYRAKSVCSKAYFPECEDDLMRCFTELKNCNIHVIGGGYNLILSKSYYADPFVIFSDNLAKYTVHECCLTMQSGITMLQVSKIAHENSLSGVEIFYDIPGSLGGAIVMNAGTGDTEIKDLLVRVKYFDPTLNTFYDKNNSELDFTYRNSFFQQNPHLIVVEATLQLTYGDKTEIKNKMESVRMVRHLKQPRDYPNAGSVFKRPQGMFVGPMIEKLGLKGFSIGGAQISEKHAGFIVNSGGASGQNILDLINYVKEKVLEEYGVVLEVEQRII